MEEKNVSNEEQEVKETKEVNQEKPDEAKAPSLEQLMTKLAEAEAEKIRLKNANDKLSRESAETKRQLRSKQTAEEQEDEARKEAERQRQEEFERMSKELNHIKAVNAYKNISDEGAVEKLIEAISESDHSAIAAIIDSEKQKAVKAAQAEWLKSRPPVSSGLGTPMTKEQIMAISDPAERRRAIANNIELFN